MTIHRKLFGALAVVVALALSAATQIPATASAVASASSLAKDLLPSSYANKIGFTTVAENLNTFKTGKKSCPLEAEEAFENANAKLELISGAAHLYHEQGRRHDSEEHAVSDFGDLGQSPETTWFFSHRAKHSCLGL